MERRISLSHSQQPGNAHFPSTMDGLEIILFRFLNFEYNRASLSKSIQSALQKRFSMYSVESTVGFVPDQKRNWP